MSGIAPTPELLQLIGMERDRWTRVLAEDPPCGPAGGRSVRSLVRERFLRVAEPQDGDDLWWLAKRCELGRDLYDRYEADLAAPIGRTPLQADLWAAIAALLLARTVHTSEPRDALRLVNAASKAIDRLGRLMPSSLDGARLNALADMITTLPGLPA